MLRKIKLSSSVIVVLLFLIVNVCFSETLFGNKTPNNFSIYISTRGNDSNNGSKKSPFRSLEGAQSSINMLISAHKLDKGSITIYLENGTYYFNKSFIINPNMINNNNISIIYKPYRNGKVTFAGSANLDTKKFKKTTDKALLASLIDKECSENILEYDLNKDELSFGSPQDDIMKAPELFFNDTPMVLSRWPNTEFLNVDKVIYNPEKDETSGFIFQSNTNRATMWRNLKDIWMFGYWYHNWYDSTVRIKNIDSSNNTIESKSNVLFGIRDNQRFYFVNVFEELDTPGEYYIDKEKGMLYFYPPHPIDNAKLQFSQFNDAFIKVTSMSNITFENITFECSRGSGIQVWNSNNIKINNCIFRNLSQNAITINGGNYCGVENSTIYNTGTGGIVLSGGDRDNLTPSGHYSNNNHIYNYSRIKKTYSAAVNLSGVGNKVINNLIHDGPHAAILFTGNDHIIEYNEIYNVCTETDDAGAIYSGRDWTYRGNIIRYNFLHHIENTVGEIGKGGIYLDDCMSNAEVFGNIFYKVNKPLFICGGRDITIKNNIIVDCSNSIYFNERGITWMSLDELYANLDKVPYYNDIWQKKYPQIMSMIKEGTPGIPKGNIIEDNALYMTSKKSIAKSVLQYGSEKNNILFDENLAFKDINNMDFSLKSNSVIFKTIKNFKNIPFHKIGIKK